MKKFVVLGLCGLFVGGLSVAAEERVDFATQIYPILRQNCVECHGPERQRGRLRLDEKSFAIPNAVTPGNLETSELFVRISLPPDDPDIMPPEGEGEPLSEDQIELFRRWIEEGAEWPEVPKLAEAPSTEPAAQRRTALAELGEIEFDRDVLPIIEQLPREQVDVLVLWLRQQADRIEGSLSGGTSAEVVLVEAPESEAELEALIQLQNAGVLAMRVAQNVNWLRANFRLQGGQVTDETVAPVAAMPNLIEVDLAGTAITDAAVRYVEDLPNLTTLNLANTAITDESLPRISRLRNLEHLNLYGTRVTDDGLTHLRSVRTLKKLFLWETDVTDRGVAALQRALPGLEIVRGLELAAPMPESEGDS